MTNAVNIASLGSPMSADSSGNVGIGTSSPAAKLDVSTSTSYGGIKINGANGASVNLYQPQSNASARNYQLLTNWEAWGTLDFQRSVDNATAPSVTLMSLNNAGTVVLKGGAVSNSGVGIAFPATQVSSSDANTLDDYEEGTWTPTGGSLTVNATGTYTKVGRFVYATYDFSFPGGGAGTQAQVAGLPFTVLTPGGGGSIGYTTYSTTITVNIERSSTTFTFYGSSGSVLTFANLNGVRFLGSLAYVV